MELYKKLVSIRDQASRDDLIEELLDRFGDPNRPVMNLIEVAHLKANCARLGIDHVALRGDELHMRFAMGADIDLIRVLTAVKDFPQVLTVRGGNPPVIAYYERGKDAEALLRGAAKVMEQVARRFEAVDNTGENPD